MYGGFVGAVDDGNLTAKTGADAFTGNTLNKNSATAIGEVHNFENINFGSMFTVRPCRKARSRFVKGATDSRSWGRR
jgi:hypothetical protein